MDEIDIKQTLLEMRRYRVGLIQTPDQLRFTYLAILEGVQLLMPEIYQNAVYQHLQTTGNKLFTYMQVNFPMILVAKIFGRGFPSK